MRITVLDGYGLNPGDLSWDGFKNLGEFTVYDRTSPSELLERAKGSEVLLTNKTVLDANTIASLPELRYIGVLATGYNVVDIEEAKKKGVIVTNIPAYSTMSVAQRVFALLLAVTDRPEHYALEVARGEWSRSKDFCYWNTQLTELAGKKFGIIGYGNIGKAVGRIALAFGMEVLAFTSKDQSQLPEGIRRVAPDTLFAEADIISLHCPLTPQTKHMINVGSISLMKPGVILINTGRGPLVDEEAVSVGLSDGKIRAFCADVLSSEPPDENNPLIGAQNAFITPHTAWASKEARVRLMSIALDNLQSYISGFPVNVVNP